MNFNAAAKVNKWRLSSSLCESSSGFVLFFFRVFVSLLTFIFAVWRRIAVDFLHKVIGYLRCQPARLLSRLSIAGIGRAGGQWLTVRKNISDEERRGHGPLLGPRRYLCMLQVRWQADAVTLSLGHFLHALSPWRRGRRTAALHVWSGAELQRRAALPRKTVPFGDWTSRPVGQQRVDAKTGTVGGRLHFLDRGLLKQPFGIQDKFYFGLSKTGVKVSADPVRKRHPLQINLHALLPVPKLFSERISPGYAALQRSMNPIFFSCFVPKSSRMKGWSLFLERHNRIFRFPFVATPSGLVVEDDPNICRNDLLHGTRKDTEVMVICGCMRAARRCCRWCVSVPWTGSDASEDRATGGRYLTKRTTPGNCSHHFTPN